MCLSENVLAILKAATKFFASHEFVSGGLMTWEPFLDHPAGEFPWGTSPSFDRSETGISGHQCGRLLSSCQSYDKLRKLFGGAHKLVGIPLADTEQVLQLWNTVQRADRSWINILKPKHRKPSLIQRRIVADISKLPAGWWRVGFHDEIANLTVHHRAKLAPANHTTVQILVERSSAHQVAWHLYKVACDETSNP